MGVPQALTLAIFIIGVKLGQRLREQDGGRAAQLPFLTYLRHGGGAPQPLPSLGLMPQSLPLRHRLPWGGRDEHRLRQLSSPLTSFIRHCNSALASVSGP